MTPPPRMSSASHLPTGEIRRCAVVRLRCDALDADLHRASLVPVAQHRVPGGVDEHQRVAVKDARLQRIAVARLDQGGVVADPIGNRARRRIPDLGASDHRCGRIGKRDVDEFDFDARAGRQHHALAIDDVAFDRAILRVGRIGAGNDRTRGKGAPERASRVRRVNCDCDMTVLLD
ncbi:hypothetical protein HK436_17095 [Mesorhizobium sediminum]|nr:hypothetical protein [Mesorhizobium sediminum]NRC55246.1 hypothetical protein [Mesorhizobium sediminum]